MAESSNNKYFFSLFTIIGICLEFWSWFLRKLLSYYASFFSYKLIWDFKEPLKIVEVIPNFAKRFSRNSKFNILLLWGASRCGVLLFFHFFTNLNLSKQSWFLRKLLRFFSYKVIWRVLWKSYSLPKKVTWKPLLSLTQCSGIYIYYCFLLFSSTILISFHS